MFINAVKIAYRRLVMEDVSEINCHLPYTGFIAPPRSVDVRAECLINGTKIRYEP